MADDTEAMRAEAENLAGGEGILATMAAEIEAGGEVTAFDLAGALWSAQRALEMLEEAHARIDALTAECERLRVIVDAACAVYEAEAKMLAGRGRFDWDGSERGRRALREAVAAEVARRE